ncbi:MAG: HPr(Ser) kinase/phosphatase [Clostridia bacterium]|nr:HPr(Ser) kinase/phosphatase [Clostridia bacterium]
MSAEYTIPLSKLVTEFSLEKVITPENFDEILIDTPEVNRPGLALSGFYEIFDKNRLSIIGYAEHRYLQRLDPEERAKKISDYIDATPKAVIFTSELEVFDELKDCAQKNGTPVLRTKETTSPFMAALISSLNTHLAPRVTRHGVLVEVYGEGLLILGDSGVGKSETAIELVKRGHRLIADDAVEIKRVSHKTLVGSAPEIIRHYIELRGIGIVDVCRLFGMGAVKETEKIDLVINLEPWVKGKMYDRLGLDDEKIDILGNQVSSLTIPVQPGRNLAIILEIAAMNNRQKRMGYNTAEEFNKRLMEQMGVFG